MKGCTYNYSFELGYLRPLLAAVHVHRIEIPYRAFPQRVGPRILSLESVDYLEQLITSVFEKKKRIILMSKTSRFTGKSGSRIEESGIEDRLKRT